MTACYRRMCQCAGLRLLHFTLFACLVRCRQDRVEARDAANTAPGGTAISYRLGPVDTGRTLLGDLSSIIFTLLRPLAAEGLLASRQRQHCTAGRRHKTASSLRVVILPTEDEATARVGVQGSLTSVSTSVQTSMAKVVRMVSHLVHWSRQLLILAYSKLHHQP